MFNSWEAIIKVSNRIVQMLTVVDQLKAKRKRGTGIGSATLKQAEIELLKLANPHQPVAIEFIHVADEEVEAVWNQLTTTERARLRAKGSLGAQHKQSYMSWTAEGELTHTKPTDERAKWLLKRWMEQDGRCAYTGLPLSWTEADLEHIQPLAQLGKLAETPDNMVFTSISINQTKADMSWEEFLNGPVATRASWTPAQWAEEQAAIEQQQQAKQKAQQLACTTAPADYTPEMVTSLGTKYYYLSRLIGLPVYYRAGSKGRSGHSLPKSLGLPILLAWVANPSRHDELVSLSEDICQLKTMEAAGEIEPGSAQEYLQISL